MKKDFLIFGSPLIEQPEIDEVVDSLKSGWIGTGPKVCKFENMFKEYKGARFAVAVNSCTAALHLSLLALDIKPGDEVIVPAMTFASTANAVIHVGAKPVLADCGKDTMNLDPADVRRKITRRTRAIIPVHFAGRVCPMDELMAIAQEHKLAVIEDCAHAIESEYKGRKAGTFGTFGCFSFYATKNIVMGEGGIVITDDEALARKMRMLALHGIDHDAWKRFGADGYKHYQVCYAGYKYNMMDLQAALGIHQLPRIDRYWEKRRVIWERYQEAFKKLPLILPAPAETGTRHAYHLYTVLLDLPRVSLTRDQFLGRMTKAGIGVGVHYVALNLHPFYQETYGYKRGDFPNAEWISDRTVSLPISAKLTDENVGDVIAAVRQALQAER